MTQIGRKEGREYSVVRVAVKARSVGRSVGRSDVEETHDDSRQTEGENPELGGWLEGSNEARNESAASSEFTCNLLRGRERRELA